MRSAFRQQHVGSRLGGVNSASTVRQKGRELSSRVVHILSCNYLLFWGDNSRHSAGRGEDLTWGQYTGPIPWGGKGGGAGPGAYMHQALPPPPSPHPPWDGSHILAPYEIFPLPPLWCGGGVALSPSPPPVVWWGCGMVCWVCMVCMVGLVWHVWKVWYVW